MQTSQQLAEFKQLCTQNGLGKEHVWQHKQSNNWIISRPGIEKIQGLNNITVGLDYCGGAADFAVVKATATRTIKPEGARTGKKLSIESLGSANDKNSKVSYYAEMAEKRAKSRAILMLMGFYALGVYGEDEADDFKRKADSGSLPDAVQAVVESMREDYIEAQFSVEGKGNEQTPEVPKKSPAEDAPRASAPLAVSATSALNKADDELESVRKRIIQQLTSHHITPIERSRMMAGLNGLTLEKSVATAAKIEATVEERTHPDALAKARTGLRSFANKHASTIGTEEYNRLHLRAGALTVTAVDLIQEEQEVAAWLKEEGMAAA